MKAIVSLSGGMDSATVLAEALSEGRSVRAVGFTYGSKHNRWENAAARALAAHYGVPYRLIDLSAVMAGFDSDLLLSGGPVPEGHYETENMRRTVVPGRNTIFNAILLGIAESEKAGEVWVGIHAGDHFIYPDCRPTYYRAMAEVMDRASDGAVKLRAPFLDVTKKEILQRGFELGVPYRLTRTCYADQEIACGRCGSCQERLDAHAALGREDPLPYASRTLLPKGV